MCRFTKSLSLSVEQLQCLQRNSASAQWLKNKPYELNGHSIIWMRMRFPADLVNADWCVRRLCADEHQGDPSMHFKWIQFKMKGNTDGWNHAGDAVLIRIWSPWIIHQPSWNLWKWVPDFSASKDQQQSEIITVSSSSSSSSLQPKCKYLFPPQLSNRTWNQ